MKTLGKTLKNKLWHVPALIALLSALLLSSCETARYLFGERSVSDRPDAYMYYDDEYYPDRFDDD